MVAILDAKKISLVIITFVCLSVKNETSVAVVILGAVFNVFRHHTWLQAAGRDRNRDASLMRLALTALAHTLDAVRKMPCLNILTNLPRTKIPKDFVDKIIPTLAKVVNKPEQKFICVVSSDALLHMHGDSSSAGAVARLESIGNLGPEQNQVISKHLADFVEKELGIPSNRFFVTFYDLDKHNVGTKGTTVAQLE